VLYNCLSWYKFVNTHLYHSRQLYNIHLYHIMYDGADVILNWFEYSRAAAC